MTEEMTHPIVTAASDVRSSLKAVADVNPTFMSTADKATALTELVRAEAQVAELRLRILADAGDLAHETAAKDAAGWLAQVTRTRYADRPRRPGPGLRARPGPYGRGRGDARGSGDPRPGARDPPGRHRAPGSPWTPTPSRVRRRISWSRRASSGRRSSVASGAGSSTWSHPEIAEAVEAARLADLEANAADRTRLTMRRLGDGTTRISGRVPDATATRFATYLEAFANPRVQRTGGSGDPVVRAAYPKRMGQAFGEFLEAVDPDRLPLHGGDATTVIVTIPLATLQADLAAADLIGAGLVPGDDLTGDRITAAQARRLACTANILPAVLGGDSLPLDLGRTRRVCSPRPSARHCWCATRPAAPRAATSPAPGARPTTAATPGARAGAPTSTRASTAVASPRRGHQTQCPTRW